MQLVRSVIELGANIGLNLRAISYLVPGIEISAVEINKVAAEELESQGGIKVFKQSILDFHPDKTYDFSFTKGVLIHINPKHLPLAYESLYNSSHRYICVVEYYNPTPVEVIYRGHKGKLFKRDFANELLDRYKDLRLIDYGFVYHKDIHFPQDDLTWFLMEKG